MYPQKNIYLGLSAEMGKNNSLSLATIVETTGSSPQIPGASAVFSSAGLLLGTLGGGILEAHSQKMAQNAIKDENSMLVEFDLTSDSLSDDEAICGGRVKILIDSSPKRFKKVFQDLFTSQKKRIPGVLATHIGKAPDGKTQIQRYWIDRDHMSSLDSKLNQLLSSDTLLDVLSRNQPELLRLEQSLFSEPKLENYVFLEPVYPRPQLVIAGAGHIGQAVAHLGSLLYFDTTVIDDRPEYANAERFPEADHILVGDIGQIIKGLSLSSDTYVVIVTRGHRHDAEVLKNCISSSAAYVGMIGSRRKIALLKEGFLKQGWASQEELERIHAPIGLAINSKTVEEIAVSIAAELVLVRSQINEGRKDQ